MEFFLLIIRILYAAAKYIKNQKERHKKVNFQEELIAFLKKYEVDYDEQYLWE